MKNNIHTAVDWLIDKVMDMIHESNHPELSDIYQQAKEMEKKQIINAHLDGVERTVETVNKYTSVSGTLNIIYNIKNGTDNHEEGEEYYNETYNK